MGAPRQPLPLVNIGGGIRTSFALPAGFTQSPAIPSGFRCIHLKVCTDPDGVTHKSFRYAVKMEAVTSLEKRFKDLAQEIHEAALEAETRRLRTVFSLRKQGWKQ